LIASAQYRFGGDGLSHEGFQAILGISLTSPGNLADNPLTALGVHAWIVELPRPGDQTPGRLILNPSMSEQAAYRHFAINEHGQIAGCLINHSSNAQICRPVLLDSGASGVEALIPDVSQPQLWEPGTVASLSLASDDTEASWAIDFESTAIHSPGHVAVLPQGKAPFPHISAGSLPYYAFSVLYSSGDAWIGLAKRSD
jgi:hypothetical protein